MMATAESHPNPAATAPSDLDRHSGMYLTFQLGPEVYGAPILKVREIISMLDITRVPRARPWLAGVINLRGKVIPVITLRQLLGMEAAEQTGETCIIVVEVLSELMGVIIDGVSEVVTIKPEHLAPVPAFGAQVETSYLLAMAKIRDRVVTLLDLDRILDIRDFGLTSDRT